MRLYKIILSTRQEFEIDAEDFEKVQQAVATGNLVRTKRAIFNPSYLVCILPVERREREETEGYIDERRGVFVVTGKRKVPLVEDGFRREGGTRAIAELLP